MRTQLLLGCFTMQRVTPCLIAFLFWFDFECMTSIIKSQRSSAGMPSMRKRASREIISDSVELCETEVCFLHIQLIGTNVWLPKMHLIPPDVDFWVFKISCKIGVLKQSQSALLCSISHMTLSVLTCVMNERYQSIQAFVTSFGPFLWSIVQVCLLTIEYQVVQYVPRISISEQFERIFLTILPRISILPLWSDGHRCME